ncbi:MAG: response regulator [Anaerolineae bacterium]|nr:response regulator [Anaerolineae bacterium]
MSRPPRILVVDDDESILEFVAEVLADEGYETLTATSGADALALATQHPPDLILLDIWMPAMDGRAFVEAYRQSAGPHAPVIVMTAARDAPGIAAETGAEGYLAKPFGLDTLLEVVDHHVGPGGAAV